ncbi:MAG: VCBS repeat-containing protein, partial [Bacteroidetes bacterium]|nr:VCBS repeat-containing protein [Bacteroidota bacterium]
MRILICLVYLSFLFSCEKKETLFSKMEPVDSGISFENKITVNDTLNALVSEFVYNGGGVAIADLNGDQKNDLFFTASQTDNALYINQGNMKFLETTKISGTRKPSNQYWSSGVSVIDINTDGKQDIYVCNTLNGNAAFRKNFLYINMGNNEKGIPLFEEMAEGYGLADTSHASHAQFFDYDLDGDLDLFIGVNWVEEKYPHEFIEKRTGKEALNRDRLFRNDWNEKLGHPVFTDVAEEAGIQLDGYSHSTLIVDFNEDHYPDIYVANDFESDDLIFI